MYQQALDIMPAISQEIALVGKSPSMISSQVESVEGEGMIAIRSPPLLISVLNGIEYSLIVYLAFVHAFGSLGKGTSVAFCFVSPPIAPSGHKRQGLSFMISMFGDIFSS